MEIRPARPEEAPALTALAFAAKSRWDYSAAVMEGWREELRITAEILRRPSAVACEGERVAGFYTLLPGSGDWELDNLWVEPGCMRRGVGRALVEHALERARAGGAVRVRVDSDPHAEAFYAACGARRVGHVAAALPDEPGRVRPQLVFDLSAPA